MTVLTEARALEIAMLHGLSIFVGQRGLFHTTCEQYHAEASRADAEPFGYFRVLPFGWTDCAESEDGAIALYERPDPQIAALKQRIAELEAKLGPKS